MKLKKTNWMSPISNDMNMGISPALVNHVKRNLHRIGIYPREFDLVKRVVIHSYRENGTALEMNVEVHIETPFGDYFKIGRILC